jgi:hypothetical protein
MKVAVVFDVNEVSGNCLLPEDVESNFREFLETLESKTSKYFDSSLGYTVELDYQVESVTTVN